MAEMEPWSRTLATLLEGHDLGISRASEAMGRVVRGELTEAQIAAFLIALRAKGETVDEIIGFRDAALSSALPLPVDPMALDIVGTGGDPYGAVVNVSSVAAIVVAAAGVPVVKHGNRGASSASGASDVLTALGVDITIGPERVAEVLRETGVTFAFASMFHPGFGHVAGVRRELGVPTVFNILGPLCNPARPEASAVGVSSLDRVEQMAGVFRTRGATALVYRGDDGIDKLTTTGHSHIWEVSRGSMTEHDLDPADLGLPRARPEELLGKDPQFNAGIARSVLAGEPGPVRDIVVLNAAAGLVSFALANEPARINETIVSRLREKMAVAAEAIDSGAAAAKLEQWAAATRGD